MKKFSAVITMDTNSNRFIAFADNNKHLEFTTFQGISGEHVSKEHRVAAGIVTAELANTNNETDINVGIAVSHWSLWQEAIRTESGILIMEDDVMTHPDIWSQVESLPNVDEIDLVFFTANTNAPMSMRSPEGLMHASLFDPKDPHPDWIRTTLAITNVEDVRYWELSRAFGLCCYFVTPKGAKALTELMFPLRTDGVFVPLINHLVMQNAVDHRMNALYDDLKVLISIPFLAYTPHQNEFAPR